MKKNFIRRDSPLDSNENVPTKPALHFIFNKENIIFSSSGA